MERKTFNSLFNNDHKFSGNEYVEGRIFGIAEVICDLYGGMVEREDDDGNIYEGHTYYGGLWQNNDGSVKVLTTTCTTEQYEQFKKRIEERYPGLLTFNWEG